MEPNVTEVDGLVIDIAAEEETHVVGSVGLVFYGVFRCDERDVRILILHKRRDPRRHDANQLAMVLQLETLHIGEPTNAVANRADGQLDHDFLVRQIHVMLEDRLILALFVDDQAKTNVEFLDGCHERAGHRVIAVEDNARVNVHKRHMVCLPVVREEDTDAVVEIKLDTFHGIQYGNLRDFTIDGLLGAFGAFLSRCKVGVACALLRPGRCHGTDRSGSGGVDADVAHSSAKVRVDGEIRHGVCTLNVSGF